jgi:hypothetical protein
MYNTMILAIFFINRTEIHTAELAVLEPSVFGFEMAVEKLKRHKSPCIDRTPAELIRAGSRTISSEIRQPVNPVWNKEELPEEWKESIVPPICKKGDKTDCSNCRGISVF